MSQKENQLPRFSDKFNQQNNGYNSSLGSQQMQKQQSLYQTNRYNNLGQAMLPRQSLPLHHDMIHNTILANERPQQLIVNPHLQSLLSNADNLIQRANSKKASLLISKVNNNEKQKDISLSQNQSVSASFSSSSYSNRPQQQAISGINPYSTNKNGYIKNEDVKAYLKSIQSKVDTFERISEKQANPVIQNQTDSADNHKILNDLQDKNIKDMFKKKKHSVSSSSDDSDCYITNENEKENQERLTKGNKKEIAKLQANYGSQIFAIYQRLQTQSNSQQGKAQNQLMQQVEVQDEVMCADCQQFIAVQSTDLHSNTCHKRMTERDGGQFDTILTKLTKINSNLHVSNNKILERMLNGATLLIEFPKTTKLLSMAIELLSQSQKNDSNKCELKRNHKDLGRLSTLILEGSDQNQQQNGNLLYNTLMVALAKGCHNASALVKEKYRLVHKINMDINLQSVMQNQAQQQLAQQFPSEQQPLNNTIDLFDAEEPQFKIIKNQQDYVERENKDELKSFYSNSNAQEDRQMQQPPNLKEKQFQGQSQHNTNYNPNCNIMNESQLDEMNNFMVLLEQKMQVTPQNQCNNQNQKAYQVQTAQLQPVQTHQNQDHYETVVDPHEEYIMQNQRRAMLNGVYEDPDSKHRFFKLAVKQKLAFPTRHPARTALANDLYEECVNQGVSEGKWEEFLQAKYSSMSIH